MLIVEMTAEVSPSDVLARLSGELPQGVTLLSAESLSDGDRRMPCEAGFTLELAPAVSGTVARRVGRFLAADRLEVERSVPKTGRKKTVDIRSYVLTMEVEGCRLRWTQSISPQGTARPGEVLEALGLPGKEYLPGLSREQVRYC